MKRLTASPFRYLVPALALGALVWLAGLGMTPAAGPARVGFATDLSDYVCAAQADEAKGATVWGNDAYARTFKRLGSCIRCHTTGIEGEVEIGGVKVVLDQEQWVTYREFPVWSKQDKHVQAYAVLRNERSKTMGKILGTQVDRDVRCLACHTGFPVSQMPPDPTSPLLVSKEVYAEKELTFGVTCEGCHGPSGGAADKDAELTGWWLPHQESGSWRFLDPATKRQKYGFWDVRSPASRTKICASCHIGSVEMGRVVTHEMYAAGHPPLPAFEVETFSRQMPEHWKRFGNKLPQVINQFVKNTKDPIYRGGYSKDNLNHSKVVLVGALASASVYLELLGDLGDERTVGHVRDLRWPELSVFDCYACHHELKSETWRQVRKPPAGVPGRPFLQEWHLTLVEAALRQLGDSSLRTYQTKYEAIRQALNRQPFGKRDQLKRAAKDAADWLYARAVELERKHIAPDRGPELMHGIADKGASELLDYDSARQMVWALEVMAEESKRIDPKQVTKILNPPVMEGKADPKTPDWHLLLDLRAGRKAKADIPGEKQIRPIIEADLEVVMPFISNYDPLRIQKQFVQVRKLVK